MCLHRVLSNSGRHPEHIAFLWFGKLYPHFPHQWRLLHVIMFDLVFSISSFVLPFVSLTPGTLTFAASPKVAVDEGVSASLSAPLLLS
jgi:hypothetical protein